jgi:hypothetical protein
MVNRGNPPSGCHMAAVAFISSRQMCSRLASSHFIIVAAVAVAGYITVIKSGASPCTVSVAVIASVTADNVFSMFARGAAVVMALYALKRCALVRSVNVAAGAVYRLVRSG